MRLLVTGSTGFIGYEVERQLAAAGIEIRLMVSRPERGMLLAPTNWPVLRSISDAAYAWFARNRLRLTGRTEECDSGSCRLP